MSQLPINIPPRVTVGKPITAAWANGIRESIDRLSRRQPEIFSGTGTITPIPFKVSLFTTSDPVTYEVSVGWGYVCTRIPGTGDAIDYHEADNWQTDGEPTKFPIAVGDAVYVKVSVDPNDLILSVTIEVSGDDQTSLNPVPGTYAASGVDGYYYFKLAVLDLPIEPSTKPTLAKWLTGSHIDHFMPGDSNAHPWKVTQSAEAADSWDVVGDTVYSQGTPIVVPDTTVSGAEGYVILKITRDEATREITEAVVEFSADVTESDYTYQYRPLAKVGTELTPKVLQLQFEEIRLFAVTFVANGAFRELGAESAHRQIYELPP